MSEAAKVKVENPDVAFERKDLNVRAIFWIGVAILVSAVIIHLSVWWLYQHMSEEAAERGRPPSTLVREQQQPPTVPGLQTDPVSDLQQMQAEEDAALDGYGWVDKEKGVVHIPVERAMDLIAARGLPATPQPTPAQGSVSGAGLSADAGIVTRGPASVGRERK